MDDATTFSSPSLATEPAADPKHPRGWVGLEVIAAFKFLQTALFAITGLGLLGLLDPDWSAATARWLGRLALDAENRMLGAWAAQALPYVHDTPPRRLLALAFGVLLYAVVVLVEGIGLWRCRRWAEYLTIVVTASFLPMEIVALWYRLTMPRVAIFVVNVVIIAFLVWQLRATRGRAGTTRRATTA